MPLHRPTILAPTHARVARAGALTVACATVAISTTAISNGQAAPPVHTNAEQSQQVGTRYFDIEANKAASMRALGLYIAERQTGQTSGYLDLEANKARSHRAR